MLGCSKKEEAPPVEEETAPPANVQVVQRELPEAVPSPEMERFVREAVPSPTMEHFLKNAVRGKKATAGQGIRDFFERWQQALHKRSTPTQIRFDAELEDTFQNDRTWANTTNQKILESACQENHLVWTITEPNTIRITKKPK